MSSPLLSGGTKKPRQREIHYEVEGMTKRYLSETKLDFGLPKAAVLHQE
ncbi:hypothetical protein J2S05_001991 [Alkalicoccobacillus murimartini]|uniref:Uncharacterized protein n=1 Tax=Alkalicoccobacillus murimartini TaxID=171685 RepID=A0ABT9YJ12_9BACI|nr:hypothetical protein [Alkalicoccobacillus murimartini]